MHSDVVAIWAKTKGPGHLGTLVTSGFYLESNLEYHFDVLGILVRNMITW